MSNRIESFLMLTENMVSELNTKLDLLEARYMFKDVINKLEFIKDEENDNEFVLDNNGIWTSSLNNLQIIGKLAIDNYNILFDEYKLAREDTVLGIALTYISPNCTKTCTIPIGEISYFDKDEKQLDFKLDFEPGEISSILSLKFSIYVKRVNTREINSIFAQNVGTILGEIYECNLVLEGQGSEFPIVTIENPEMPLWDMEVNFEALDDLFSIDTICLKINKSHKDFPKLGVDKISKNNNLIWKEILASFFTNLFLTSNEIESLENLFEEQQDGTVGGFLKIGLMQFNIETNEIKNPAVLSAKIRKELDSLL